MIVARGCTTVQPLSMRNKRGQAAAMDHELLPTIWSDSINAWLAWLTAGGLPTTTLYLRHYQLRRFASFYLHRGPWALDTDDLAGWLACHQWGPETLRSYRAALRSFYGWAHASGVIAADPAKLLRKIKPAHVSPRPAKELDIATALSAADDRQWLMLMLGSRHGLRRGETAQIHTDDLIDDGNNEHSLLVHGKGAKPRVIPLLLVVAVKIRLAPPGWVFPNGLGGHITAAHVGVILRRILTATPHQLRHRFASKAYQQTHDIRAVQELLGHASVATTQRYTAVADGGLRRVLGSAA